MEFSNKLLAKYEQDMVKSESHVRALAIICDSDKRPLINKIEGLTDNEWLVVSNITTLDIPADYFDIVLWSDCDIESELRRAVEIYPKLKPGARVYFNNLLTSFGELLRKCLSQKDIKDFVGGRLNTVAEQSTVFARVVRTILAAIFDDTEAPYVVQIVQYGKDRYIVLRKNKFSPISLSPELEQIDEEIRKKFPPQVVELSIDQIEKIRNRIFELVVDRLNKDEICEQLVAEKLLLDCKVMEVHYSNVMDSIKEIDKEIENLLEFPPIDVEEIVDSLKEIVNLDVTDKDHWEAYIIYRADILKEAGAEKVEKEYPAIHEPKEPLPAVLLPGLANIGGFSCFMDSVLFTILLPRGGYFERGLLSQKLSVENVKACSYFEKKEQAGLAYLTNFQQELRKLAAILRGYQEPELTCRPIVEQMRRCDPLTKALMSEEQQDDSEFLRALMQMFQLTPTVVTVTRTVSNDKKEWIETSSHVEKQAILEVHVPDYVREPPELASWYQRVQINNYQNLPITEWHKDSMGRPYQYSREKHTIESSDALIFHVARRQVKGWRNGAPVYVKNTNPVSFKEYIRYDPNKHLSLQTLTIHHGSAYGGHYTAFFKHGPQWFHYDDTAEVPTRVRPSTWEEVTREGARNGSLFIYVPIS